MTEDEKKLMIASFVHDATKDDKDPWTEEALLAVAEKIMKRITETVEKRSDTNYFVD